MRSPLVADGVEFRCYRRGVERYVFVDPTGSIEIWANYGRSTYSASVGGANIGDRFRSKESAARAAVRARR